MPLHSQNSDAGQFTDNPSGIFSMSNCRKADEGRSGDDDSQTVEGGEDGFVELTLISAQGLKDVKIFGSMSPYAVIYIDPSCKHRTCTSKNTGSSPVWDYFLCVPIPWIGSSDNSNARKAENDMDNEDLDAFRGPLDDDGHNLTIEIFSPGALSDVLVGTAHIPLQEIIQHAAGKLEYLACQLVRPSGRIQGLVNLSVQFKGPSLPRDSLLHLMGKATKPGQSRDSWLFLADRENEGTMVHAKPTAAAPDVLDFKGEGERARTGGISQSRSSPTESMHASTSHSPVPSQSEFLHVPLPFSQHANLRPQQHHQHQHQHQQLDGVKAMFDSAFDALVVADAGNDATAMSMPQGDKGSLQDALLGLAMSQPSQGQNASFQHSHSS